MPSPPRRQRTLAGSLQRGSARSAAYGSKLDLLRPIEPALPKALCRGKAYVFAHSTVGPGREQRSVRQNWPSHMQRMLRSAVVTGKHKVHSRSVCRLFSVLRNGAAFLEESVGRRGVTLVRARPMQGIAVWHECCSKCEGTLSGEFSFASRHRIGPVRSDCVCVGRRRGGDDELLRRFSKPPESRKQRQGLCRSTNTS